DGDAGEVVGLDLPRRGAAVGQADRVATRLREGDAAHDERCEEAARGCGQRRICSCHAHFEPFAGGFAGGADDFGPTPLAFSSFCRSRNWSASWYLLSSKLL